MPRSVVIAEFRPKYPDDYVWEPLWLKHDHAAAQLRIDLLSATEELKQLYPPDECRRLVADGQEDVVAGLYWGEGWNNDVAHVLCLGADLHVCPNWRDRDGLIKRLRNRDGHRGARFEVGLWAGLTRVGANPAYLDPDPTSKAPDLLLEADGLRIAIEAKAGSVANTRRNFGLLYRWILDAASLGCAYDVRHLLRFFPDHDLVNAFRTLEPRAFERRYEDRVRQGLARWYSGRVSELAIGPMSDVPGLGRAQMLEAPRDQDPSSPWNVDIVGIGPSNSAHEVTRAGRKVREAGSQLAIIDADVRVAVVWVSSTDVPATEAVLEDMAIDLRLHRRPPSDVDWLALFNSHHTCSGRWSPAVVAASLRSCEYDITQADWYRGLTAWKGNM